MPAPSIDLLIEFTKDEDPRTRATAIAGLAKVGDPKGFAPVVVALFDPVDEVRLAAAAALGIFADERACEPLVECLSDPSCEVGVTCAWALGQIPATICLERTLAAIANTELLDTVRTAAATAVGERAETPGSDISQSDELIEKARATLLAALAEDDGELRAAAVWSLGHLPSDPQTVDSCITSLDDPYEWVVRYAIEALVQFDDARAIEPLERLAGKNSGSVAELATRAITLLRG